MANNGRGETAIKEKVVGWVSQPTTNAAGVDNTNVSGSLKQENQPTVGWATQPTNNAAGVDVSGSLSEQCHPNKSATPMYSEIASPVTQARNDDKGNLKDNHNAQTTPDGVIAGSKTHPTAEENDYRVGIPAHQNAAGVNNENISGSLKNDHLTAQTTPDGVAVGKNAHPTAGLNYCFRL